jgi:ATP/maltotriose-dependent transcriptional regulator MalT
MGPPCPYESPSQIFLVEAERNRVLGKFNNAILLYDEAIRLAKQHGYIHEQAIANELAAKFFFAHGDRQKAVKYLQNADMVF